MGISTNLAGLSHIFLVGPPGGVPVPTGLYMQ